MTFKCMECSKIIRKVEDVRNCTRCQSRGAAAIPQAHEDSDCITPAVLGYLIGSSFSHDYGDSSPSTPAFDGGGGDMGGAGASGSWDSSSDSNSSSSDSSYDSGSSSDSGLSSSGSD